MNPEDWVSQAEAARLRKVTPQAITSLIATKRVRTVKVGGRVFVSKRDILEFEPLRRGPKPRK